jgi:hypothetical protein
VTNAGAYYVNYSLNVDAGQTGTLAFAINGVEVASTVTSVTSVGGTFSAGVILTLAAGDIVTLVNVGTTALTLGTATPNGLGTMSLIQIA